ncbi:PH domain-containing protein [Streptomyces sp. enrichment culture]|uniref:PH domain-containing protein n=1 Tax=Streptomyces sp. enrichment culture TaxID=1795815 RepID=UPI003F54AE1B
MGAGTDGRVIRTYRLRAAPLAWITLALGLPGVPLVRETVLEEELPPTFRASMLVLLGAVYLGIVSFYRAATIVCRDHLAVRRLFGTRRTAWSDVLGIESWSSPASHRTMLLDREGRLFALLGGVGTQPEEVRAIQDRWVRSRGEGWTPPADAFVLAARRRAAARESATVWAIALTAGSFLVLLVTGLVLEFESGGDGDEIPWLFQVIGFVPVVVFVAVRQVAVRLLRPAVTGS